MNPNQIINMVMRLFFRKAVNKGIDMAAGKGKQKGQMTPEERAQAQTAKEMTKRARQVAKLARRMGKF